MSPVDVGRFDDAFQGSTMPWAVARFTEEFIGIDCPFFVGIEEANIGRCARAECARVEFTDLGSLVRE